MTKINSKAKGNTFERKIANLLSERFEAHTGIKQSFRRNADSGSFMGGKNQSRMLTHDLSKATFGDLITPDNFKFTIECKAYKVPLSFKALVDQKCAFLDSWISQAEQDANNSGKLVLIIVKFNGIEPVAITKYWDNAFATYKGYYIQSLSDFIGLADSRLFEF